MAQILYLGLGFNIIVKQREDLGDVFQTKSSTFDKT